MEGEGTCIEHPLIRPGMLQARLYQQRIFGRAMNGNLLVVLPTGLGKTPIAIMLAAHRLKILPDSRLLILAPTKPLAAQHFSSFRKFLNVDESQFQTVTGETKPPERVRLYETKKILFATTQTIQNDIEEGRISLRDFSLLVVDEAHHSIGGYAYPFIAKRYLSEAANPRVLALSASPGATREKIKEICDNLGVEAVDIRTELDADVEPYVQRKDIEYERVTLPASFMEIRKLIEDIYSRKLVQLRNFGFTKPVHLVSKKDLLALQGEFMGKVRSGNRAAFGAVSIITQCIKLEHSMGLLETQGIKPLGEYWKKMRAETSKTAKALVKDKKLEEAMALTQKLSEKGSRHPKISKLCSIVEQELQKDGNSRIIVFANYRASVDEIVKSLGSVANARPVAFVGQKEGVTQKHQIDTVRRFRDGDYNILVATSVGEEGLDIPSANLAVFYEPVPSPLR